MQPARTLPRSLPLPLLPLVALLCASLAARAGDIQGQLNTGGTWTSAVHGG